MRRWLIILALCAPCFGQSWSGVVASSLAIDWGASGYGAGLPATFPDGETTTNPWTPPTRTQCGSTLTPIGGGSDDSSQITTALTNGTAGHYVLLGSGTFTINSTFRISPGYLSGVNNVSLRGSGAQSTKIN